MKILIHSLTLPPSAIPKVNLVCYLPSLSVHFCTFVYILFFLKTEILYILCSLIMSWGPLNY